MIRIRYFSETPMLGGAEAYLIRLARSLPRDRFEVSLICPAACPLVEAARAAPPETPITVLPLEGIRGKFDWRRFRADRRFFRQHPADILHFSLPNVYQSQYSILAARRRWFRAVVATYHVAPKERTASVRGRWLERRILRRFDRIIAVSEASRRLLVEHFAAPPDRTVAIYNGVDSEDFPTDVDVVAKRRELGVPDGARLVAVIGRLSPEKGQATFLQAFALLRDQLRRQERLPVHGLLVGDGPDDAALRQLAASLDLKSNVTFTGYRTDVPELLAAVDLCVAPSVYDAFNLAIAEAMGMGRPVIGTRVEGIPEVIEDGVTGRLVPPEEPAAMAAAMAELLADPARCQAMGQAGIRRVGEHFTFRRTLERTVALYETLLARSDGSGRQPF